jgi:hypothetical protein
MPVITGTTIVLADTTSVNLLAGDINEFLGRPSVISLFTTGSAVGLRAQLLVGKDVVIDDQAISDANRFPITPDDFLSRGGGFQGDRLTLRFHNVTAGDLTAEWRLSIESVQ